MKGGRGGIRQATIACRYGAHAMEFSINMPTRGALGRQDSNPHNTVLEAAVLPLNYVPKVKKGKEKPLVRCP
jgi:hypothetical protein